MIPHYRPKPGPPYRYVHRHPRRLCLSVRRILDVNLVFSLVGPPKQRLENHFDDMTEARKVLADKGGCEEGGNVQQEDRPAVICSPSSFPSSLPAWWVMERRYVW